MQGRGKTHAVRPSPREVSSRRHAPDREELHNPRASERSSSPQVAIPLRLPRGSAPRGCNRQLVDRKIARQNPPSHSRSTNSSRLRGRRVAASNIRRWISWVFSDIESRSAIRPARSPARRRFSRNRPMVAAGKSRPSTLRAMSLERTLRGHPITFELASNHQGGRRS